MPTPADGSLETISSILAVVLEGEKTFWLGLQTKPRPLEPGWKGTNIFWFYPFEGDIHQFSSVPGFDVTDTVYVIDRSAHSRVEMFATLVIDVQAKRYVKDRVEYYFVSCNEVKRLEELYRAFRKRELMAPPVPEPEAAPAAPTTAARQPSAEADKTLRVKETRANKEVAERVKETLEKKERTPPPPPPPPPPPKQKSDHCNTEVFHWQNFFLVPQRQSIFLCPSERDNTYGFRLHKVTVPDAVSLLMFERTAPSSEAVDGHLTGTPIHDKSVTETELGKRVLTVTPSVWPLQDNTGAKRPRPAEVSATTGGALAELTKKVRETPTPPPAAPPKAVAQPAPPKSDALQAVGVNCWSDVQRAVPPVAELAKQHAFEANPTAPLQTAVFADGVAVTYSPAVATKVAPPAPAVGSGAEKKVRKAGGGHATTGSAIDEDMRDLLQHIQLAKEHAKI